LSSEKTYARVRFFFDNRPRLLEPITAQIAKTWNPARLGRVKALNVFIPESAP
jgi:hypothetical protein